MVKNGNMVHPNILQFENEIKTLPTERCAIFSADGEKILERNAFFQNLREICGFDDSEFGRMHSQILTHNHPSKLLFSKEDIILAVDAQLAELRVVTVKGTFSLKPTSGTWPGAKLILTTFEEIGNSWDYIPTLEQSFRNAAPSEGLGYFDDHDWYIQHLIWKIVAERLGLLYHRNL